MFLHFWFLGSYDTTIKPDKYILFPKGLVNSLEDHINIRVPQIRVDLGPSKAYNTGHPLAPRPHIFRVVGCGRPQITGILETYHLILEVPLDVEDDIGAQKPHKHEDPTSPYFGGPEAQMYQQWFLEFPWSLALDAECWIVMYMCSLGPGQATM